MNRTVRVWTDADEPRAAELRIGDRIVCEDGTLTPPVTNLHHGVIAPYFTRASWRGGMREFWGADRTVEVEREGARTGSGRAGHE